MSGGYVKKDGLKLGEHQVVIFTFKGKISPEACRAWNSVLKDFKEHVFGDNLMSVTLDGLPTPQGPGHFDPKVKVIGLPIKGKKRSGKASGKSRRGR